MQNKFVKFIGVGGINTILSYAAYIFLALFLNYQLSYALAYLLGIAFSFVLNARYVFETEQTMKKFALFPFVYVVQYLAGALMMNFSIERLGIDIFAAPLIVAVALIPLSYFLSKKILVGSIDDKFKI